jgi:ATP-binding cassette subfamily A (ABC1) protein 3
MDKDRYEGVPRVIAQRELEGKVLKISDLKKTFDNGLKAVEGVNLKMYSDQIFVLLGHNGAGKTTTINMLTGLYEQSEGHAELFGIDMFNDMNAVRQVMGVCPQHDVLFELLTTEEHLSIFYDLKGADPKLKKAEIEKLMKDVGIYDKKNALASQLSGGNKRKLSVAIALCGNSKFVLLDEPTSGMDLSARRQLWNVLKEYKKDRIILITTHYMDEADILGDRIAIMTSGKVTALGSSIFLKSTFGVGYNLTLVKSNSDKNETIMPYIQEHLGDKVIQQSEIQQEMTLQIPTEYAPKFAQFFEMFD